MVCISRRAWCMCYVHTDTGTSLGIGKSRGVILFKWSFTKWRRVRSAGEVIVLKPYNTPSPTQLPISTSMISGGLTGIQSSSRFLGGAFHLPFCFTQPFGGSFCDRRSVRLNQYCVSSTSSCRDQSSTSSLLRCEKSSSGTDDFRSTRIQDDTNSGRHEF